MAMPAEQPSAVQPVHPTMIGAPRTVQTRVTLQPIAAPSILGLFGFSGATLIVAANLAHWYGTPQSPVVLFPFAAMFGGLAQFLAGMWSYRARDGLATAMHGMWGAFWLAYGVLFALVATHVVTPPPEGSPWPELAFWFIPLAAITWSGAAAAMAESLSLFLVLSTLAAGSTLAAIGFFTGSTALTIAAGWVFVFSAGFAWYTASAMMLESTAGKVILPLGKLSKKANTPGEKVTEAIEYEWAEPGVRKGQ